MENLLELLEKFSKEIKAAPKNANSYYNRAIIKGKQGDIVGAIADYTKTIELNPNDAEAYNDRGVAKVKVGDVHGAIQDYTKAIEIDCKYANAYHNRGNAKSKLEYFRDAIGDYTKAIEIHPRIKNAHHGRGTAKDYLGDKTGALTDYTLEIEINPTFWPDYPLSEQLFTQLAKVYSVKGDYHRAYLYSDSALTAKDSVSSRNNSLTLANAHDKIEFAQHKLIAEQLQNQIKIDSLEIGKKRIEITFFFVGIAALLLVILFIARERKRSELLLLNILPEKIAERLKRKEHPIADYFDHASILFIDMAGFTLFSDGRDPKDIVNMLNTVFTRFDAIAEKYKLEKIKTIGDCYMAVSGLPDLNPHHAEAAAKMALEVRNEMKGYTAKDGTPIAFRIGLDCGPVVAGVIGRRKFIYDLWGDTVNTASRMESTGLAGEIHCSDRFRNKLEGKHTFESRGVTEIKGKGMMETWLIVS